MVVALVLAVVFLAVGLGRAAVAPFGDSHDGRNGGVWAGEALAIREDGLLDSRLGARYAPDGVYANHPPLIALETAAAEWVLGDHRWATRAPAWAGTIGALALCWCVLTRLGASRRSKVLGVLVGASLPMTFVYGSMLDTPVTSLPFAMGMLAVWIRPGRQPGGAWLRGVTVLGAALAGWQGLLLGGLTVVVDVARGRRSSAVVGAAATVGAIVVLGAWQLWVHGSLANLVDQAAFRTGVDTAEFDVSILEAFGRQATWLNELASPVALLAGLAGMGVLVRRGGRHLDVAVVLAGSIAGYSLLLPGGAFFHDYWTYWIVAGCTIGSGAALDALTGWVRSRSLAPWWSSAAPLGAASVLGLAGLTGAWDARSHLPGTAAVEVLEALDGDEVLVVGLVPSSPSWITDETGLIPHFLDDRDAILDAARVGPETPVLTTCEYIESLHRPCSSGYAIVAVGDIAALVE